MRVKTLETKLLNFSPDPLKGMFVAARNCYLRGTFNDINKDYTKEKAKNLLKKNYESGHLSIFEQNF